MVMDQSHLVVLILDEEEEEGKEGKGPPNQHPEHPMDQEVLPMEEVSLFSLENRLEEEKRGEYEMKRRV